MMPAPIIPITLAGALLILSLPKKKRKIKRDKTSGVSDALPESATVPDIYKDISQVSNSTWIDRQEALRAVSQIEFITKLGDRVPLCSKCDPESIDGIFGTKTESAVKAFQAIAGLNANGDWSYKEDMAMYRILTAISNNIPISCDPLIGYPAPLACFASEDGYALLPGEGAYDDSESPANDSHNEKSESYGQDDILVIDPECNVVLHQSDDFFNIQKRRIIAYALEGLTDSQAAIEINESMLADYAPLCLSLGKEGVGPGVREFWNTNTGFILSTLQTYNTLPELLEEDAKEL